MKKNGESKNTWRLNEMVSQKSMDQRRYQRANQKVKSKENGNITFKKSKGNIKVIDKGKFIVVEAYQEAKK